MISDAIFQTISVQSKCLALVSRGLGLWYECGECIENV